MVKIIPINQAEAIFAPLFDMNITNMHELVLSEVGRSDGQITQFWDSCAIISYATEFSVQWKGSLILDDYDSLRFFINYHSHLHLSGTAIVNGTQQELFRELPGSNVPLEPTSKPLKRDGEKAEISQITLRFHCTGGCPGKHHITFYWMGLLASDKEYLIEEEMQKYDESSWEGLLNNEGKPAVNYELFFTHKQLTDMKKRIHEPLFKNMAEKLKATAEQWESFIPEKEIREYIPVGEHLYRYVRIRDRNRKEIESPILALSIAGYLFDNSKWTKMAARMMLSAAHTPKWFEGPQACMDGSTWHHVCFAEDHHISAIALALSFIGDVLTPAGVEKVLDAMEKAWKWVNHTCEAPGYRWYMNQGLVGNRGRIIGAYCLHQYGRGYEEYVEQSYIDHTTIINNYLNEEGHCPEGPHYYQYSFENSVLLWLVYANYKKVHVRSIVPEKFKTSLKYVESFISSNNDLGSIITVNASWYELFNNILLSFYATVYNWDKAYYYLNNRMKTNAIKEMKIAGIDLLLLLNFMPDQFDEIAYDSNGLIVFLDSGVFSYAFDKPAKGKFLFLCERNPFTGHYHEDRGSFVLEINGKTLLLDPGNTNYANIASQFMGKADYHNLAYPEGLSMNICNPKARKSADEAGIGCTTAITMEDFTFAGPTLEHVEETPDGIRFSANMKPLYGEQVLAAIRAGELRLDEKGGELTLLDAWSFDKERSLNISFLSYVPWTIGKNKAETVIEDMKLVIQFSENRGLGMRFLVDDSMIDSQINKIYTLRVKTDPAQDIEVTSQLKFYSLDIKEQ